MHQMRCQFRVSTFQLAGRCCCYSLHNHNVEGMLEHKVHTESIFKGLFFPAELLALVQEVYTEAFFLPEVTSVVTALFNSATELSATVH